jgi:hypothetical protein
MVERRFSSDEFDRLRKCDKSSSKELAERYF